MHNTMCSVERVVCPLHNTRTTLVYNPAKPVAERQHSGLFTAAMIMEIVITTGAIIRAK